MRTFTASRLTAGNKVFPNQIAIDEHTVTLKIPALFSGKEKTLAYNGVSSVNIICPVIGFSSISITTIDGEVIVAKGFRKKDVREMRDFILAKI